MYPYSVVYGIGGRYLVCANDVNLSGHVIEDISIKFVIRRWETEDILRHGPECGHMACRSVYKASILRPAMAFSIYGATANVHGLIFA